MAQRVSCLTFAFCPLFTAIDTDGPLDDKVRMAWQDVMTKLEGSSSRRHWGITGEDDKTLVLCISYDTEAQHLSRDLERVKSSVSALEPYIDGAPQYLTAMTEDCLHRAANFVGPYFSSMDVFVLRFQNGPSKNPAGQDISSASKDGQYQYRFRHTDSHRWLNCQPFLQYHGPRVTPDQRVLGEYGIGMTLDTYLTAFQPNANPADRPVAGVEEVLILGWRTAEQRQRFLDTPDDNDVSWTHGFEAPLESLVRSGDLALGEKWSITQYWYKAPQRPANSASLPRKDLAFRVWKGVKSKFHR